MILDMNLKDGSMEIDTLIKWLQDQKKGGAEEIQLIVSHLDDASDSELIPIIEHDDDYPMRTIKLEAI